MIREELQHLAIDIDSVHPHPRNVRQGDIGAICESLKSHGQYRSIVYQKSSGRILAGNHTWKAAKALGWSQIAATPVVCDDEQALRILLADNRANDLADYDNGELLDILKEIADTPLSLEGTLFDADFLEQLQRDIVTPLTLDVDDAFSKLPTNDRPDATQMTFTLTLDQAEQVKQAIAKSKKRHEFQDSENDNSNGNALWAICDEWQRQVG